MSAAPAPPVQLDAPPTGLGRLAAPLHRLAAMQGAWPPVLPRHVVRPPAVAGLDAGERQADGLVDAGADLVVVGGACRSESGRSEGSRSEGGRESGGDGLGPALATLALLLGLEPIAVVGTAATPGWAELVVQVRAGLRAGRPHLGDTPALLDAVGAVGVAGTAGLLLQCARRRTPVLLSAAPDVLAAAVAAERLARGTSRWLLAGTSAPGSAGSRALREVGLEPLLDLELDRPEGAELALGLLLGAVPLAGPPRA